MGAGEERGVNERDVFGESMVSAIGNKYVTESPHHLDLGTNGPGSSKCKRKEGNTTSCGG